MEITDIVAFPAIVDRNDLVLGLLISSGYGWIDIHCTSKEYNDKNMIGILKTFSYLASDKTYRKMKPLKNKLVGKLKSTIIR